MATARREVDAVLIGVGLVGTVLGRELTRAGLTVVGLERGRPRDTVPDFQGPQMHDELRYATRLELMQDTARETLTFRHTVRDTALPMRRWASFLPGTGLGGSLVHWNGETIRYQEDDFRQRSRVVERYGRGFIPADVTPSMWASACSWVDRQSRHALRNNATAIQTPMTAEGTTTTRGHSSARTAMMKRNSPAEASGTLCVIVVPVHGRR
ncbi:MAG TPA: hypothetical protein VFB99_06995 [Vicinamibacterales bacterium]|nr:hypothetical protein [Vicinamibacterales bacterium]